MTLLQVCLFTCLHITQFAQWQWWLVFVPEKFWQVPFPCLACNVKPWKQQAAIAENCQRRCLSLPLHKHVQLVLSHRFFDWLCSLFEPFLNKVVILLYPTGDDWANCSHGSRIYNDFGVQGEEASSVVFKWIYSFLKSTNKSLKVYLSWRLFVVHGFVHGDPHSLHIWMSCYAQSFWANKQSVAQQSPTISKHLDCWQVLLHHHFLSPLHCTAHVLVHNKSTIAKGLIHWWVPLSSHMSQRYTDNHLA